MKTGLSVAEAQRIVLEAAQALAPETVTTRDALGRVLAERVHSRRTLPPADCSAMDGYAVRAEDLAGRGEARPPELLVRFEVPAGGDVEGRRVGPGEAARIFTGAPIPPGADTVVRQEDAARAGDRVRIVVAPPRGENVREAGEDVRAGDAVLEPGATLGPAELGVLASIGRSVVSVVQRPRVALLSGGDELVEPDGDPGGGRIVSSNSYTLAAQCRVLGAEPVYLGIAEDRPEALEAKLRAGLAANAIVSSAGVSVGDRDYVRPVLEKLGCTLVFWGVEMKPGFPFVFGRFERSGGTSAPGTGPGPLVFGLPGNPVSAMVTFEQFVRPALRRMMGFEACFRPTLRAVLGHDLRKSAGRAHFVRVRLRRDADGTVRAESTGNQSSGVLRSMALAQGLLVFPAEATQLRAGDAVTVQIIDDEFFAQRESGL